MCVYVVSFLSFSQDIGLRTEMSISANNLHAYSTGPMGAPGVAVTFSLKEFKALLNLTKELEHRVRLKIEAAGQVRFVTPPPVSYHRHRRIYRSDFRDLVSRTISALGCSQI